MNDSAPDPAVGKLSILVVEDSGLSFALTKAMIERLTGNEPDWAKDGATAVDKVMLGDYDLVIMDHMMPGMCGVEATRIIREQVPEWKQPFIAGLSGATTPKDLVSYEQAGMNRFLAKPMRLGQLQELLEFVFEWEREAVTFEAFDSVKVRSA